jgi:hypothetical protein
MTFRILSGYLQKKWAFRRGSIKRDSRCFARKGAGFSGLTSARQVSMTGISPMDYRKKVPNLDGHSIDFM